MLPTKYKQADSIWFRKNAETIHFANIISNEMLHIHTKYSVREYGNISSLNDLLLFIQFNKRTQKEEQPLWCGRMWSWSCMQFSLNAANVAFLMALQFAERATKKYDSEGRRTEKKAMCHCHSHRRTWIQLNSRSHHCSECAGSSAVVAVS